jgi:tetratricopeptide (TPR) repeat protein
MNSTNATARYTGVLYLLLLSVAAPALYAQGTSRGVQFFESGDWAGAKAEFSVAVQRNDRDARSHYYLGRLAMLEDDADTAAEHFERAVTLDQSVSDYHLWYGNAIGQQGSRVSMLKQPFLARRMKSELERAVELDARNIDARDGLVDFYSMAPGAMGGSTDKAREQAQAIAQVDAMRGHLAFARLAVNAKDTPAVEREMNAAIAAAPDNRRGYSALALWYEREKKWPQAFATLDPYIKRYPDDPYGRYGIGRIAAASGQQLERGEKGIRAFLAKPPKDAGPLVLSRAYQRLGQVLEHQGKRAEARSAFEQAVKIDPRNEEAKKALTAR